MAMTLEVTGKRLDPVPEQRAGSVVPAASAFPVSCVAVPGLLGNGVPLLGGRPGGVDHPLRRSAGSPLRRMTISAEIAGEDLDSDAPGFIDDLRSMTLEQLYAIAQHLGGIVAGGGKHEAQDTLSRVRRVISEHEGLESEEQEDDGDFDEDWEHERARDYDPIPAKMRGGKSKKKRKAKDKPPHTHGDDLALRGVARDYAGKIRTGGLEEEWEGLATDKRREFLRGGRGGVKMGDAVEKVGEGKVQDRAVAEYGEGTRVWTSTKLRLRDTDGELTGDLDELDFLIVDPRGQVVSAVSAKTSPTAVAPAVDRGHLANYYGLPARFDDPQTKLQLARTLNIAKKDLANKNELWFEYTEDGTVHSMPVTKFREEHPLSTGDPVDTRVMGLTPYARKNAGPERISLGLTEDEMFDRLFLMIDQELKK
jgi:hypothetical protein